MSNAQAEQLSILPADAHDPQDDRATIATRDDFDRNFADALAWEAEVYGNDPTGLNY